NNDSGATRVTGETRHGQECLQRVSDARATVPVADEVCRRVQRLLATLQPQRRADPCKPGAKGEYLDIWYGLRQRVPQPHVLVGKRLHRAGYIDQEQHLAKARTPSQASQV